MPLFFERAVAFLLADGKGKGEGTYTKTIFANSY
jgi:hypothetical protein